MKGFRRRFATLLAATMLVSGLVFAPVNAEETSKTVIGVTSDGGFVSRDGDGACEIVSRESFISEDVVGPQWNYSEILTMDDLILAFGDSNVSRISDTEVKLLNDIQFSDYDVLFLILKMPELTIDFNGHICNGLIGFAVEEGNVTLIDSSGSNTGGIRSTSVEAEEGTYFTPVCFTTNGGYLTIKSGNYSSCSNAVTAIAGNLTIEGGVFDENVVSDEFWFTAVEIFAGVTSARIMGGEFNGEFYAVLCYREPIGEDTMSIANPTKISGGSFSCSESEYGAVTYMDAQTTGVYPDINELLALGHVFDPDDTYNYGAFESTYTSTATNVSVTTSDDVEGFVYRLYSKALDREPDTNGYTSWLNQLKAKTISGSDAAFGFFFSSELANRNLTNREFITLLYNVFLNRTPDDVGMQAWLSALESGASRKYVFAGFANSQEWKGLCADCGIAPGSFCSDEPRDQNIKVTAFAQRLYTLCLNRNADVPGLNYWTDALVKKIKDGAHVAHGFFFSAEFTARNLSNADYIEVLYQVLLGRGSDATGRANWVAQLDGGKSRLEIFKGFVHSAEFDAICKDYGIVRGEI